MKIPVCSVNIGPVYKRDVLKAMKSVVSDKSFKEYASILAFDVRIIPEASEYAESNGIKIFTANIIYHLFDQFTAHVELCRSDRKKEEGAKAVFPSILEIVKSSVFNNKSPIIIGVTVKAGVLKVGTPLCIPDKENLRIGVVESIQLGGKNVAAARTKDGGVSIKIVGESHIMVGRHFDETSQIASYVISIYNFSLQEDLSTH
jgi:translation initiation factor 5B